MITTDVFDYPPFPTLTTERLVLRELTVAEAADVFIFHGDSEAHKYNAA